MNSKTRDRLSRCGQLLLPLPGFILLAWIVTRLSWSEVIRILATAEWLFLLMGLFLFVPVIMSRARRWQLLLSGFGIIAPYGRILRMTVLGFSWGVVTPGQTGDFIRLWYLKQDGFSIKKAFLSVLADRFIDLAVFGVLAAGGLYYFMGQMAPEELAPIAGILIIAALVVLIFIDYIFRSRRSLIGRVLSFFRGSGPPPPGLGTGREIQAINMPAKQLLELAGVSLLEKAFLFLRLYVLALALDIRIDVGVFIITFSLVTMIQAIPLTIEGIGFREAAMVFFLGILGFSMAQAVGLSVVFLAVRLVNAVPGFFLGWRPSTGEVKRIKEGLRDTTPGQGRI